MARRAQRFTIYDMMEQKGVFEANPANADARDSNGLSMYKKAEFPMMVYHPTGEERITVPGEIIATPMGPRMVGQQKRLIDKTVTDEEELAVALEAGWHKTPAAAIATRNGEEIPKTQGETIEALQAQIAKLELERNSRQEEALASAKSAGAIVKPKLSGV